MAPADIPPGRDSLMERLSIFDMPVWTHGDDHDEEYGHGDLKRRRRFRAVNKKRDVDKPDRRQVDVSSLDERALLDLAKGVGAAAGAVAGGVGKGAKAISSGQGVGAAAGAVAGGVGRGVGAVANAGKAAGDGLLDFLGGGSSGDDSQDDKKKKKKPPPKAEEPPPPPPPPSPTLPPPPPPPPPPEPEPPQTSETIPEVSITPRPPPQEDPQPSSSQPPQQTGKPVNNIPPPKAELPKPATSASEPSSEKPPPATSNENKSEPSPTSTADKTEDISLSTLVPGATTSVSGSIPSLTPVVTGSIPAITSGVRKGIDREPPDTTPFAMRPSSTIMNNISSSDAPLVEGPESTNGGGKGTGNKDVGEDGNGGGLNPAGEKALISVLTILGVLALIAIAFFVWRRRKARKTTFVTLGGGAITLSESSLFDRPKELARRLAAKTPILRNRFADRGWVGLDEPYSDDFAEKKPHSSSQQEAAIESPIAVQSSSTRSSATAPSKTHVQEQPKGGGLMPKPSISSTAPQINLTLPSTFGQQRLSDLSSLSSGFGDGDIIMPQPTANVKPYQTSRLSTGTDAEQSQKRDTVYTEASEDTPPRFRTVNSWVRQQTGRVKRAKQREEQTANETGLAPPVPSLPPEQEFRLMMPDGEEPRRVEDVHLNIGTAH